MLRIVHVIERFSGAGPERGIIASAKIAAKAGLGQQHIVCALEAAGSPVALTLARQTGIQVLLRPDRSTLVHQLAAADIVQVHFWNNPALYAFLRSELPAMRLVIRSTVFGHCAPQVVTRQLVEFADLFVATSPGTLELPIFQPPVLSLGLASPVVIPGIADFDRLDRFTPRSHEGFVVGYVGTVNFAKLHPAYVAMSAAVRNNAVRFDVAGDGGQETLKEQAAALGAAGRFTFRGYVENIRGLLETWDLFGYPLRADTYATSEKALQEAMWVGVPPVVFPYGGVRYLVEDGVTGVVVQSEHAYTAAIERLFHATAERKRLAHNAQAFARSNFAPVDAVRKFSDSYDALLQQPKRARRWPAGPERPADWFVAALGDSALPFAVSLAGHRGPELDAADAEIAAAPELVQSGEGGIIHYRNHWPQDPHLRYWTGLVFAGRGELARSAREFQAASDLGLDGARAAAALAAVHRPGPITPPAGS